MAFPSEIPLLANLAAWISIAGCPRGKITDCHDRSAPLFSAEGGAGARSGRLKRLAIQQLVVGVAAVLQRAQLANSPIATSTPQSI
jgi:hypothetical protein